jgi:dynein heavy chain, axonemal
VIQAFRNIQIDKINDYLGGDSAHRIIFDFLNSSDTPAIFFRENRSSIEVSDVPIKQKGQLLYFVKLVKSQISETKIANEVIVGDIFTDPLEHLAVLSEKIYHPIVASQETGQVWSEAIAKEVRDNFDTFVANVQITQGHVRGVTCLPIPGSEAAKIDADLPLDPEHSYQVHALEGAIITWTKQIKNILKQDPESVFQIHTNPGPLGEIEFWTSKAGNLNGIFDQLQSVRVRRVLKILDKSKSTYNQPFAKLCKEVFHARAEVFRFIVLLSLSTRPIIL